MEQRLVASQNALMADHEQFLEALKADNEAMRKATVHEVTVRFVFALGAASCIFAALFSNAQ